MVNLTKKKFDHVPPSYIHGCADIGSETVLNAAPSRNDTLGVSNP